MWISEDLEQCLVIYNWAFCARRLFDTFSGYIGSCTDVHNQRLMKEELEKLVITRTAELYAALEREKDINELRSWFVSIGSHELRTPLSIVLSSHNTPGFRCSACRSSAYLTAELV